jgi:hypothetical protein
MIPYDRHMSKYDVVAVDIESGVVRIIAHAKDEENAEAIVKMAVMRRGVDEEFFSAVPEATYQEGDFWKGPWHTRGAARWGKERSGK